ncbi:MAG TPA: AraC family transcriptional regulator [Polyangiaceae bacterium]|jgi:AraC-like DNA-binding protein|nr:AraC family transcriptional regulator [Polyangiaceae bacterium]
MSVSIFLVRAVLETAERSSAARADFRAGIPFDWRRLEQPEARLELEEFERVLSAAVGATGDEALGLHVAEQMPESAVDLLGHMAAHAPTMREAINMASQFAGLGMDGLALDAHDDGDTFVIRYAIPRSTPLADGLLAELFLGGVARMARLFTGAGATPRLACFEHERPAHHLEYTRVFGGNQRFGQSTTSIAFDRAMVNQPQMHQHPELYELLRAEAQRRLDRMAATVRPVSRLRQYLRAMPPSRIPEIPATARALGMSERSLRRHLAADGTSYRDVVRSALEASAGRMLRDPARTIKETAVALGFADAAAFHRAFKRWTGMTPGEYRRGRD